MARFIFRYIGTPDALVAQRKQLLSVLAGRPFSILDDSPRMLLIELSFDARSLQPMLPVWKVMEESRLSLPSDPGPPQEP